MTSKQYLDKLLACYKSTFDLERPWSYHDVPFSAYGYFYSHNEKYVLTREARMWETNSFEHIFFTETDALTLEKVHETDHLIRAFAEPELVRKGDRYPERNHMYTYLTNVFLCSASPYKEVVKLVRAYRFTRNYLFTFRGWCEGRMIVVDLAENRVWCSPKARPVARFYKDLLQNSKIII